MRSRMALLLGGAALAGSVLVGAPSGAEELRVAQAAGAASPELIARGRALFNDAGLSADGKWACGTCHPSEGHTDNRTYVGVTVVADGDPNGRSTPTSGARASDAHTRGPVRPRSSRTTICTTWSST